MRLAPVNVDGFLTRFRRFIAELRDDIANLDGKISKFQNVLRKFRRFTNELSVFISGIVENRQVFVRIRTEFRDLVTALTGPVTEFGRVVSGLYIIHIEYLDVLTDYNNCIAEFNVFFTAWQFYRIIVNVRFNNYVPRVSPASYDVIERLERVRISREETCSICFDELSVGSEATRLQCSHNFHGGCIAKWLRTSAICPVCRSESPCQA